MDVSRSKRLADAQYASSPLRRRSKIISIVPETVENIITNDDEAELQARRIRRSEILSTPGTDQRRQSLGINQVAQLTPGQMQEQISLCIKLNAENKINLKNAFSLNAIDILTYLVKNTWQKEKTNLQVASSSLDVSAKIYGLRVDSVYNQVLKMCGALEKQNKNDTSTEVLENGTDRLDDQQIEKGETDSSTTKKKKKKKNTNILTTVEALKGTVETMNIASAISNEGDPQTSDVLYQCVTNFRIHDNVYMKIFDEPEFDLNENKVGVVDQEVLSLPQHDPGESDIISGSTFQFLNWSADNELIENYYDAMEIDLEDDNNTFMFDINDSFPNDTPFPPTQDTAIQDVTVNRCNKVNNNVENIVDFRESILANTIDRDLEYSVVLPSDIIRYAGPTYWKVKQFNDIAKDAAREKLKQQRKKKDIVMNFNEDKTLDAKFEVGQHTKVSVNMLNIWNEENVTYFYTAADDEKKSLFAYFTKPNTYIMPLKKQQVENHPVELPEVNNGNDHDNDDASFAPMIDAADFQGENSEADIPVDLDNDMGCGTQGVLTGENLVAAPSIVEDINIPYSKRAKKIDMRQLKRAMWKVLCAQIEEKENMDTNVQSSELNIYKGTTFFSNVYKTLPKLLNKNNAEALSAPIAFVSLLHLANEQTLVLSTQPPDFSDVIMKHDFKH